MAYSFTHFKLKIKYRLKLLLDTYIQQQNPENIIEASREDIKQYMLEMYYQTKYIVKRSTEVPCARQLRCPDHCYLWN